MGMTKRRRVYAAGFFGGPCKKNSSSPRPTRTRAGRVSATYLARFLDRYAHRIMVYYNSCFSGMWQGISTYIFTHVPLEYLV